MTEEAPGLPPAAASALGAALLDVSWLCPTAVVVLERFSAQARDAVGFASTEARRLEHGHVGTEHLLLGIQDS